MHRHLGSAPTALIYLPPEACFGYAGMPERPKGADCKSAGNAFGGSNPSPGTVPRPPGQRPTYAPLAQLAERRHGKAEVSGSNPEGGSNRLAEPAGC